MPAASKKINDGSLRLALRLSIKQAKFLPAVYSNMAEEAPVGTRGEYQEISRANTKCRWTLTLGPLKQNCRKSGTRWVEK